MDDKIGLRDIYDNILDLRRDFAETSGTVGELRAAVRGIDEKADRIEARVNEVNGAVRHQGQRIATLEGVKEGERTRGRVLMGRERLRFLGGILTGILGVLATYAAASGKLSF